MAPSPEYDKEPKAPDKNASNISCEDSKVLHNIVNDQQNNSDLRPAIASINSEVENNKHVSTLDDGQLRALLDEAITYKCPKDREGKSVLFKELLQEAEQDEQQECEAAARSLGRARHQLPHSNSLQDLMAALSAETAPRRHPRQHAAPPPSVSARAIHGGSLPSGVDTYGNGIAASLLSEEPSRGAGYLATVRCVNPPPLAERRVSASDANGAQDLDLNSRRSKPMFPVTYTARATLEIGSGSVGSGRAVTTTTASNQVDSAIPFSCITTPEVVDSCNTTSSSHAAVALDAKPLQLASSYVAVSSVTGAAPPASPPPEPPAPPPEPLLTESLHAATFLPRSVISSSFNGLPLTRPNYGSTANDDYKKSIDENGNSVQGFSSPLSGSSQHKKPRRKKSSKNETVIDCEKIDGYQGDKDVNELLRFIESNVEGGRGHKLGRAKHRDDCEDKGKKRRKDKEARLKRASSLEELSRTTLEELTAPRRRAEQPPPEPPDPPDHLELTDFQTVTKRRKPRRREPEPGPPRRARPPSDRSNDSNDDLDSVHSLPADAPPPPRPAPAPASYADIARTRHNIPDLIESCNFYGEGGEIGEGGGGEGREGGGGAGGAHVREYPALEGRRRARDKAARRTDKPPPSAPPAPDVVGERRPAVVLRSEPARLPDMEGVTFGFDVNEQLLERAGRGRCDLVPPAPPPGAACPCPAPAPRSLRFAPPPALCAARAAALALLVDYVGSAWEDVVRCGGGKVRYFSE